MDNFKAKIQKIFEDPAASYWLKTAVSFIETRDPVDYLNDVESLREILTLKCELLYKGHS